MPSKPLPSATYLTELAQALSGLGSDSSKASEWTQSECHALHALAQSAIRQGSLEKLEQVLDVFGGLPPLSSAHQPDSLLAYSARFDNAKAFGFLFTKRFEQVRSAVEAKKTDESLVEWLRGSMRNSAWGEANKYRFMEAIRNPGDQDPLVCVFFQDNVMALACILANPECFDALALLEPKQDKQFSKLSDLKWGDYETAQTNAKRSGSIYDTSLLTHAIEAGAYRCAALLTCLPEFSAPLMSTGFLHASDRPGVNRRKQEVFEETGEVEFSFFEWAIEQSREQIDRGSYGDKDRKAVSFDSFVSAAIDHASDEMIGWTQDGTGMGWPEVYFSRYRPHAWASSYDKGDNKVAVKIVGSAMDVLARFEAKGFSPKWDYFASCTKGCGSGFHEWLSLRAASKNAGLGVKNTPSL